jgi:cellulose synthase (UDP-forming)
LRDTGGFFAATENAWWQVAQLRPDWWWKLGRGSETQGLIASLSNNPDAVIQGIESPWSSDRSVILIALGNEGAATNLARAFLKVAGTSNIGESVSVLHGSEFTSYRLGESFYHVGYLPWWLMVRYRLKEFPWLIVVLTFVLGMVVVPWTMVKLNRHAEARLEVREK